MDSDQILEHFRQTDALLEGHFILSSGLHSLNYLQCALALQYPFDAAKFGVAIAEHYTNENIETVASPAIGPAATLLVAACARAARRNCSPIIQPHRTEISWPHLLSPRTSALVIFS